MNVKLAGSRRLAGIAAMSALALTLAACGNGDTAEDDTTGSDTGATTDSANDTGDADASTATCEPTE